MYFRSINIAGGMLLAACLGHAQQNLVLFESSPGDYIGLGRTYATTNRADFNVSGTSAMITVVAFGFYFQFAGPGGADLTPGSYPNSARYPFNGTAPGLDISGNGRGCNTDCGGFQVKELQTGGDGQVNQLWVTFSNSCECGFAPMIGEIRFNSQLAPSAPAARTLHVPSDYPTIQAAIDAASVLVSDTVLVTNGTYFENLDFKGKVVTVRSVNAPQFTIIDGRRSGAVVNFSNGEGAGSVIGGFTIQNGYSPYGSGISLLGTSPSIVGNIFLNNAEEGGYYGAAIGGNNASPFVTRNRFENNTADNQYLSGVVSFVNSSAPVIVDNIFANNPCRAINFLLPAGNLPTVVNNTITGNDSGISATAGVFANNLLFGNRVGVVSPGSVWQNNLVYGGQTLYEGSDLTGTNGNISANPFLTCPPSGDFHLVAGSPCIDAGWNGAPGLLPVDYDGNPRVLAGHTNGPTTVDIGAFEFNPAAPSTPCLYLNVPSNVVAVAAAGQNSAVVNYPTPDATSGATLTCSPPAGSVFRAGTNVVTCTLSYRTNVLANSFTVTVLVPPYIAKQPSVISALANSNVTVSVGILGTPPPSFAWSFGGVAIPNATNSILTVPNVQSANEGYYQVSLANELGTVTGSPIFLRVLPAAATVLSNPVAITVSGGRPAVFSASVIGSAPLLIQWYKDGEVLPGANSTQFFIPNAQAADMGTYQVAVSNSMGNAISAGATLTVLAAAPAFVLQPPSIAAVAGTSTNLEALAVGTDTGLNPIRYAWYFQSILLPGQNGPTLAFRSVSAANQGAYFVVATNSFGAATSTVAQLTVDFPPTIVTGPSNQIVSSGSSVVLSATAVGTAPLAYAWSLNGQQLSNSSFGLTLTNLQPSESGYYSVIVTNQFGSSSATGLVSVFRPPSGVVSWGDDSAGQTDAPMNLVDVVMVAGGDFHSLALREDGSLLAWGADNDGQTDIPANTGPYVAIATGANHNLAITESGAVVAWGLDDAGQCEVPAAVSAALAVAAGDSHSLALLASGTVVAWGNNDFGQTTLPAALQPRGDWTIVDRQWVWVTIGPPPVKAIAAGRTHNLALFYDSTVVAWGDNGFGQASPPPNLSNVVAITAGYLHSAALLSTGTVVAWGDDAYGQTNVPPGLSNVVAIAAGDFHTLALRSDGSVVGWGDDSYRQTDIPAALTGALALASGYYHGLALIAPMPILHASRTSRGLLIDWTRPGILQWAPTPLGPFQDVLDASQSYIETKPTAPAKFFRVIAP